MTRFYLRIFYELCKACLARLTGASLNDSRLQLAVMSLFNKSSFRLPDSSKRDVLIIPRIFYHVIKSCFTEKIVSAHETRNGIAAIDTDLNALVQRKKYMAFFNVNPGIFLSKSQLLGSVIPGAALVHLCFLSFLVLFLLPFSFSRRRASISLIIRETAELVNLLTLLKKEGVTQLYYFCIYEKDSNFSAYILSKEKISVIKITSEVPLVFANKEIIADEIKLGFGYQREEVEHYRSTIICDKIDLWMPEMQVEYIDVYNNKKFEIPKNTIGFYSSAFWLRKQLDHSIADVGSYDAEELLLLDIKEYLLKRENLKLVVFSHPYEKRTPEQYEQSLRYYAALFDGLEPARFSVTDRQVNSVKSFNFVNIGVSVFSTIIFERLSLGFKCLLAPFDKKDFPLGKSPFRNICAYSRTELFNLLDKNIALSKNEYFTNNNIQSYVSDYCNVNYELY